MADATLNALSKAPKIMERLLRVFPTERLDDRIEADRFTAREVIAHLAHYEQIILDRIRVANQKPGHQVPYYNPDAEAAAHKYHEKDVFHEAEVYESRRGMTLEYLQQLSPEDMAKHFTFEDGRTVTIAEYVNGMLRHDMEHLDQISMYLATEVATIS
jgi:uncharacterized damage-inducible protein DinB